MDTDHQCCAALVGGLAFLGLSAGNGAAVQNGQQAQLSTETTEQSAAMQDAVLVFGSTGKLGRILVSEVHFSQSLSILPLLTQDPHHASMHLNITIMLSIQILPCSLFQCLHYILICLQNGCWTSEIRPCRSAETQALELNPLTIH